MPLVPGGFHPSREQPRRLKPTRVTVNRRTGNPIAEEGGAPAAPGRTVTPSGVELGGPPQVSAPPPQTHHIGDILGALDELSAPILGGRTVAQTAKAALNLGVDPLARTAAATAAGQKPPSTKVLAEVFGGALAHLVNGTQAPKIAAPPIQSPRQGHAVDVAARTPAAKQPPHRPAKDPLGRKTLGDVTEAQLAHAEKEGTLKVSKRGILTTPQGRGDLAAVARARRQVARSGPNLDALHAAYPELSIPVLKSYADAFRRTGVPPQLLAGIEQQESDYGRSTLPGVHSGQNFAGAAGPFQIGNGTGASGDAWQTVAQELWGDKADQHSPYNQHDAALVAGQYLAHTFGNATANPATWKAAAESYNHAGWYGDKAVQVANEHAKLAKLGLPPNPSAQEALKVAVKNARADGINPTPNNGDVEGGRGEWVLVRADARGMVNWAESTTGTQEGTARQQAWAARFGLSNTGPWCANWVSNGLLRRGFSAGELPANPNNTGTPGYEQWGEEGKHAQVVGRSEADLASAKPGDVLTFSGEHTALYVGNGEMISGNFGDEVERTPVAAHANLSMIIRPDYKGGRVKIKAGQLPAATPGSATAAPGSVESITGTAAGGIAGAAGGGQGAGSEGRAVSIGEVPVAEILSPEHQILTPEQQGVIQRLINGERVS